VRDAAEAIASAGMVLAQFEIGDEPIREAFAIARAAGRATLLNPSPWRPVDPAILADTSILVCNRVEAAAMAQELPGGADDLDGLARALLARGPGLVVITLGGEGAAAWRAGDAALRRPAVPVEVVDTLGAGDAFAAGLAVALLEGRSLSAALDMASACGALVCTGTGVFDRLPTRAEVARLLGAGSLAAMPV
jgi:ribokinase